MAQLPETGETAPDFTLPTDDGGTVSLRELLGLHRAVAVFFYPKDDTSGCTKEALAFSELHPRFADAGCAVVGVSADSIASHRRFKAKHDLSITLASDPDHEMLERYGVWVEKRMYGRRFMGVQRATVLIGPGAKVLDAWPKVKVDGHAQAVLDAVRELA